MIVGEAKLASNVPVTEHVLESLCSRVDCFGKTLITPMVATVAYSRIGKRTESQVRDPVLGDILYLEDVNAITHLSRVLKQEKPGVPIKLAEILSMTSSLLMLEYGEYDQPNKVEHNTLTFEHESAGKITFEPNVQALPVRAGLSLESGMKTRLTTAAPAAFVQIGQLIGNRLRDHLSHDPFLRVGFEEADKLWEVLKAYDKRYAIESI
jgi:hypothetical protein